ncbi:MAG: hypothetical protein ACLQDC_02570 [Verrucomicrobiia bacterium]
MVATIAAPGDYQPYTNSADHWLWNWYVQATNNPDCWGLTPGQIPPPTVTLRTFLVDSNTYYSVYSSNIAAEVAAEAAQASSTPTLAMGGGFMAMDDDMDDGDPCTVPTNANFAIISISQDTNGWTWLTAAPTCTNYLVGWFSTNALAANSLSTNVTWTSLSGGWAGNGTSTFADQTTCGVTQMFYYAVLVLPTTNSVWNGCLIPEIWLADQGLNPFDPNIASEISTNPWAHGLTNLQAYENPSVLYANNYSSIGDGIPDWWRVMYFGVCTTTDTNSCATCDPEGDGYSNLEKYLYGLNPLQYYGPFDFVVNGGQMYTASLTVSIQALNTNYPDILIGLDPSMSNATSLATSGGWVSYTLPDNGDGEYELFLQDADGQGQPHGPVISKVVTLDQTPPVVYVTSPASNAVLDQAFITLQAVAADPNPVVPDAERPLSIWINGQQFWDRNGTNIVIERFPVPAGSNSFTVTILAVDPAGNTNQASQTWTVDLSTATNAPNMLTVNLSSSMLLPNVNSIWVEGTMDNDYALINAIVYAASGDVTTNLLNVRQNQYEGSVPLESGTNQLVLVASDAAGNTSSNTYTIISSTEFSGAITNPVYGVFATAPSNTVSGYVSALYDAGLPTQTNVTSVTINGVAAVLGTNVDAYGNIPFWTTNAIPLGVPITATIGGPGIPTDPPTLPPMQSQVYEITQKNEAEDDVVAVALPLVVLGSVAMASTDPIDSYGEWDLPSDPVSYPERVLTTTTQTWTEATGQVQSKWSQSFGTPPDSVFTFDPDQIPWNMQTPSLASSTVPGPISRDLSFGTYNYDYGTAVSRVVCSNETYVSGLGTLLRSLRASSIHFLAPREYGPNTTVIFTFEGVTYRQRDGVVPDLSQIQFQGQSPVSNDTSSVSYLMTVNGGQEYAINQDSFQWPSDQQPYTEFDSGGGYCPNTLAGNWTEDMHFLSWTDFHNALPQILGPTNLYVYCNSSPSSGVFYVTNAIPAVSVNWSAPSGSDKVQISSPTENPTVISPTDANHASSKANDVTISAAVTFQNGQQTTLTQNITVRKPGSFGPPQIKQLTLNSNAPVNLQVNYAVWDQICTVFPPGLIGGAPATESFPSGTPPNSTTGNRWVLPDGTVQDWIEVPYSTSNGTIHYVQVITADCASVTNDITTNPDADWANIVQTGPCH